MTDRAPELIVALDVTSLEEAGHLIETLRPAVSWFKVGLELFAAAGPAVAAAVHRAGGRVFLDLKLHDIPNTVAGAVRSATRMGVELLTLHLSGGDRMVQAAVEAVRSTAGARAPRLLGVFRLTSDPEAAGPGEVWSDMVRHAAHRAAGLGLDGMIAAARDVPLVRSATPPGFLTVTPGIRPAGASRDDQARTATPAEAARAGSDFIVVGRPITRTPDPLEAARRIMGEMHDALAVAHT